MTLKLEKHLVTKYYQRRGYQVETAISPSKAFTKSLTLISPNLKPVTKFDWHNADEELAKLTNKTQQDWRLMFGFGIFLFLFGLFSPFKEFISFSSDSHLPMGIQIGLFILYGVLLLRFHPFLIFKKAFIRSETIAHLSRSSYTKRLYGILDENFYNSQWFDLRDLIERRLIEEILEQNLENKDFWQTIAEDFSDSLVFDEFFDDRRQKRAKTLKLGFVFSQRLARRWRKYLNSKKTVYLVPVPERISISERIEKWCWEDGFGVYVRRGNTFVPSRYGCIPATQWKSQWLLEEQNAQMRQILIREIGWEKIIEELNSKAISCWREYQLIAISNLEDEEIRLLKMVCPSTGHIHVLRVPLDISSAKDAIIWCNWGIAPENFISQT